VTAEPGTEDPRATELPGCARHPDRPTGVSCTRCGNPICPECMRPAAVGFQCPACVREGSRTQRPATTLVGAPPRTGMPVTWTLLGINVAMFVLTGGGGTFGGASAARSFTDLTTSSFGIGYQHQVYRLLTGAFLHLGVFHLFANMYALIVVGSVLEPALGRWRYLALYLVSAFGGGVAVYLVDQNGVGASGAIFGLFGAVLILVHKTKGDLRPILLTIGINLVVTFAVPGISKGAHLGGLVTGALLGAALAYLPAGPRRTSLQVAAFVLATAVLGVLTAVHTASYVVPG